MTASAPTQRLGRKAERSNLLDHAVRLGLVCYGLMHLLVAWLALQLLFGSGQGKASSAGALSQLARTPFGNALLWVVAAGFFALALWRLLQAVRGHRDATGGKRVLKRAASGLKVMLYGALGYSALRIAMGGGSSGSGTDTLTARLMSMPGGAVLVALVGVGVAAYGLALVYRGTSEGYKKHLEARGRVGDTGRAFMLLGKVGYLGKGVALLPVAGLFVWAALSHDPQKSGGLDQALRTVLQQPFGAPFLVVVAVGIACYGVFCFAWAWHLDR
ncbi:MAG TPA: DUF1206 domain-containing protein [Nocardioidaceae bacterium]